MPVYRYKRVGPVDIKRIKAQVPPADAASVSLGSIGPTQVVDITAPTTSKDDLDDFMASSGWSFDSTDPSDTPAEQSAGDQDHGELLGLGDDDHTIYHNNTRGDARYYQKTDWSNKAQLDLVTDGDHDVRTDNPHGTDIGNLGSGTITELNTAVTDATLDDSSASRPPSGTAGGDLGGTYPNPTVDDGADSTAIHDNVSAEISAVTEKTTPVSADLLLIEDSAASNAKKRVQIGNLPGGGSSIVPHKMFQADQMESPNSSDWAVNALAPLIPDANDTALSVRAFDDSSEEGIGFTARVPTGATNMILGFLGRAATAPGSTKTVAPNLYSRAVPDNATIPSWSSETSLTDISIPTNAYYQKDSQTIAISTLGLTAGVTYTFELTRDYDDGDDLSGDWLLHSLTVGWS